MLSPLLFSLMAGVTIIVTPTPTQLDEDVSSSFGITSGSISVTPTGGTAPYTYHVTSGGSVGVSSPTSSSSTFTYSGLATLGDSVGDNIQFIVTDAHGATGYVICPITIQRTS